MILLLCLVNYLVLGAIQRRQPDDPFCRRAFIFGVTINVLLLLGFKLLATCESTWTSALQESGISLPAWLVFILPYSCHLPLGISFLTFQAISMLADEYHGVDERKTKADEVFNYPFIAEHFSRGLYVHAFAVDFDLVEKKQPDIVILEVTQRYLGLLR